MTANHRSLQEMNIEDMPVMMLSVNHKTEPNLYNYVDNVIVPEIEKITDVSDVSVSGGQEEYIQIQLIPEKLKQYHLDMSSIAQSVGSADFTYPAGDTIVGGQKLSVSAGTEYNTVDLLKQIPITLGNGNTIYLEDIANVGMALEDTTGVARYNGQDTISIGIKKLQSAAAMDVSKAVNSTIENLKAQDPNLDMVVVYDSSDDIQASLKSVMETMVMAVIISMIIIFLFLWRNQGISDCWYFYPNLYSGNVDCDEGNGLYLKRSNPFVPGARCRNDGR